MPDKRGRAILPRVKTRDELVMIFRAVFWIGLVSLLTPHEPDLGLGRPGAGTALSLPASLLSASGLSRTDACAGACAGAPISQAGFTASLSDIKAQIEQARRARSRAI